MCMEDAAHIKCRNRIRIDRAPVDGCTGVETPLSCRSHQPFVAATSRVVAELGTSLSQRFSPRFADTDVAEPSWSRCQCSVNVDPVVSGRSSDSDVMHSVDGENALRRVVVSH